MVNRSDFITDVEDYLADTEAPLAFQTWAAVACVAGALERRVWFNSRPDAISGKIYPTQSIFHIAPTGVGKAPSLKLVQYLWKQAELEVGTESMTAASFYDEVSGIGKCDPDGNMGSPMLIATEELSSFFIEYDPQLLGVMLKCIDCSDDLSQSRRTLGKKIEAPLPSLTCLFAGQPSQFNLKFPLAAYALGFMGRSHIIYSDERIKVPFFSTKSEVAKEILPRLTARILEIAQLEGEVKAGSGVKLWLEKQQELKDELAAPHVDTRLEGYFGRRVVHIIKIAMVKAISRGRMTVFVEDCTWALAVMEAAEKNITDAFQGISADNDSLHISNCLLMLKKRKKTSISKFELFRYFHGKVSAVQAPILISAMVGARHLIPVGDSGETFRIEGSEHQPKEKVTNINGAKA